MSGLFLTGKIKALLDRLTSTRAAALDEVTAARMARLDATVASRQSEASAASRFATLEADIAALVSGRVKSIQTGYFGGSALSSGAAEDTRYMDVSITAVDAAKSVALVNGISGGVNYGTGSGLVTARLTSSTNVRLSTPANVSFIYARWTVVEFY